MCENNPTLFERFIENIDAELKFRDAEILPNDMVSYTSNRTGRKAFMSAGRFFATISLGSGLRKKYVEPGSDVSEALSAECEQEFLFRNEACRIFNMTYDPRNFDPFVSVVRGEVIDMLSDVLDSSSGSCLNISNVAAHLRVGPGSNTQVDSDAGTFGRLMDDFMSFSSPEVKKVYKACTLISPLTYRAEAVRQALYGVDDILNSHANFLSVPKTDKERRAICTQPSGNMSLQLSTHEILCDCLKHHFDCDLSTQQDKNRMLAFLGSHESVHCRDDTWAFCTEDLKKASDFPRVIIQDLCPDNWVEWLGTIRSTYINVGGQLVEKHIHSSMGNGFTFALMTLLLSTIVKVLYRLANISEYDYTERVFTESESTKLGIGRFKTWAVYGDDIIVDKRVLNGLKKVLSAFGFVRNEKKSFSTGPFRESCGGDYFHGLNVRPVYCESLSTQADVFSLINRLVKWGVYHSVDLVGPLKILRSAVTVDYRVPNWEDVCSGLHVPLSLSNSLPLSRVPLPLRKATLTTSDDGLKFYRALEPVALRRNLFYENSREVLWSCIYTKVVYSYSMTSNVKMKLKRRYVDRKHFPILGYDILSTTSRNGRVRLYQLVPYNLPGMVSCMLEGSVRVGQYGMRGHLDSVSYEETVKVAPMWGDPNLYRSTDWFTRGPAANLFNRLWEQYVSVNLFSFKRTLIDHLPEEIDAISNRAPLELAYDASLHDPRHSCPWHAEINFSDVSYNVGKYFSPKLVRDVLNSLERFDRSLIKTHI